MPRPRARRRTRPTGRASRRSTTSWRSSTPSPVVELNRAVARVDGVRPAGRPRARRRAASPSRRSSAITCCRACAATCWSSSGALRRGARRVRARRVADAQRARARAAAGARACPPRRVIAGCDWITRTDHPQITQISQMLSAARRHQIRPIGRQAAKRPCHARDEAWKQERSRGTWGALVSGFAPSHAGRRPAPDRRTSASSAKSADS